MRKKMIGNNSSSRACAKTQKQIGSPSACYFIFAAISEELGTFFAICLILVEISCFILFINIALKMTKRFYKLTAFGLAIEYIFQVFLTIGGVIWTAIKYTKKPAMHKNIIVIQ